MDLQKIYRGMKNGAETIQANLEEVSRAMDTTGLDVNDLKNVLTPINREQGFGFGLTGRITRVGNVVIATCLATQTNPQGNGSKDLSETIPVGYRPAYKLSVQSYVYVGSAYQDTRHHRLLFKTDGHITALTSNMGAAPLEISFNVAWVTNDPMPSAA